MSRPSHCAMFAQCVEVIERCMSTGFATVFVRDYTELKNWRMWFSVV